MTIVSENDTPKPTPESSLSELKATRARWLQDAEDLGWIKACTQVARWLGSRFDVPRRAICKAYRWESGNVVVTGYEEPAVYSLAREDFELRTLLTVEVDGKRVCYYQVDAGQVSKDSYFVPGKWLNTVLMCKSQAEERARVSGTNAHERERARLLELLLIGQPV
jgi:hypothetical protein